VAFIGAMITGAGAGAATSSSSAWISWPPAPATSSPARSSHTMSLRKYPRGKGVPLWPRSLPSQYWPRMYGEAMS
jgi:hypothetical protein